MTTETRWIASLLLAPVIGFLCFFLPTQVAGDPGALAMSSANMVSRTFEAANLVPTTILLVLAGFGLRWFAGKGTWLLPFLLIASFPVATAIDITTNPASHNLLPFELAIQFAYVVPPLVGTLAASALAKRRQAT